MRALRRRFVQAGPMRSVCAGLALLAVLLAAAPWAVAQNFGMKQLQGKVFGSDDAPLSGAIVYLENSRNNDIKSYITEKDGAYHFAGIAADTDFTVWAAFKGKKSPTKKLSSFDSRKQVYLDLHIKD
jgi:carboxypeptidase family protein